MELLGLGSSFGTLFSFKINRHLNVLPTFTLRSVKKEGGRLKREYILKSDDLICEISEVFEEGMLSDL